MALALGTGVEPAGALGNQLSYISRRGVLPRAIVQIWNASPTACGLLSSAELETGGIEPIQANVQYQPLTTPQWASFAGQFQTGQMVQGIQPAAWPWCEALCPIPVYLAELLQQEDQVIQSILNLRFTDAGNATRDMLANAIFNSTGSNVLQIIGFPTAIDDGTYGLANYAGIARSGNTWWQSKHYAAGSVNPTRALLLQYLIGVIKQQGEKPDFIVTGLATWALLAQDFVGIERAWPNQDKTDTYVSGFTALEVMGVPVYGDVYCPEGKFYAINTNYLSFRIHRSANWEFFDFQPMTPAFQMGWIGVMFVFLALINTKPRASSVWDGFNFPTL